MISERIKEWWTLGLAIGIFLICSTIFAYALTQLFASKRNIPIQATTNTPPPPPPPAVIPAPEYVEDVEITVSLNTSKTLAINNLTPVGSIPKFIKVSNTSLKISPTKKDYGTYTLVFSDTSTNLHRFTVTAANSSKDYSLLKQDLSNLLGTQKSHYAVYVVDLIEGSAVKINTAKTYPPASLSKLPSVVLALRDVDSGKYKLDSTFAVQQNLKHTNSDSIGILPAGTKVTLKYLVEQAILVSSNTAHYHLHKAVLGGKAKVVPRTKAELGISNFFLDPHTANADSVGKLLEDIYHTKTLKPATRRLLLQLMQDAVLKNGIAAGIPASSKARVANKEGFLYGGLEGDTYSDAGIVFGEYTDYVIVVLNDDAPPYPGGRKMIAQISKLVYSRLDKP